MNLVRVQTEDFDVSAEIAQLRAHNPKVGAVVTFLGTVRDLNENALVAGMELEHYPGMTEQSLEKIVAEATARWTLFDALVVHRVGALLPQDQIVLVACTAAHRGDAFAACEFIIDYLKTDAPFWKKEQTADGARWVDARVSDGTAMEKWSRT
jgi:molybdopterin synthase catalytic subunit